MKPQIKKIKLSLSEKKRLSNVPKNNGLYFIIGLVTILVIVFVLFQMKFETKIIVIDKPIIDVSSDENIVPPDFVLEKKILELPLEEVNRIHIQELTTIKVVEDDEDVLPTVIYDSSVIVKRAPRIADVSVVGIEEDVDPIPISLVSELPVFPGCESVIDKEKKFECFQKNLSNHILRNFNNELAIEYGLTGKHKIMVTFVINTFGDVVNIKARAPHPELKKEVIKAVNSLPKMKPAQQGFKKVSVTYALPVIFKVDK